MLKVAVASTDGIHINEHFGRASEFMIYEVDEEGKYSLIENRKNNPHCPGDRHVTHVADTIADQLSDVQVILVSQIGPGAARTLSQKNIRSFALSESIDKALTVIGKKQKLLEKPTQFTVCTNNKLCGCDQDCH